MYQFAQHKKVLMIIAGINRIVTSVANIRFEIESDAC